MSRPTTTVHNLDNTQTSKTLPIPDVFSAPIRTDIVRTISNLMRLNARQPYAVDPNAGHRASAASWGTGRAVSRIPRVNGSGTHRAGQGAFGNMCRGGRMFAPTKIWRKWGRVIPLNQKRYAICSAVAASGVAPLVIARGHRVDQLSEVPFVVDDALESINKTKDALKFLSAVGLDAEVERVESSKKNRCGRGKMRDRPYVWKKGPLVVYGNDKGVAAAFHGVKGVDTVSVKNMSLLDLAPGAQVGRLIIWTESGFKGLDKFGSYDGKTSGSTLTRRGRKPYFLPQAVMKNTDLSSIVLSDAVVGALRDPVLPQFGAKKKIQKKNPFKSYLTMKRLNPYFETELRNKVLAERREAIHANKLRADSSYKVPTNLKKRVEKSVNGDNKWKNTKLIQNLMKEDEAEQ